ncbi:hypothetical protein ACB092_04G005600 [Castanea dentata]
MLFRSYFCCRLRFVEVCTCVASLFVRIHLFIHSLNYFYFKLWKRFMGNDKPPAHLGYSRNNNVDIIPKLCIHFLLSSFFQLSPMAHCSWD